MAFIKRAELRLVRFSESQVEHYHRKAASTREFVFLSHSHHDGDIVSQTVSLLGEYGVDLYIDWKDHTMPEITGPNTANRLKKKIQELRKFILLASNRALASHWVPWELGVADATNGLRNVAIMPVEDVGEAWRGNEYIAIYPRIEKDPKTAKLFVVFTDGTQAVWLDHWLAS